MPARFSEPHGSRSAAFVRRFRPLWRLRQSRVVHICGQPGSGKTAIRDELTRRLSVPAFGIDDERVKILKPGESWPENDALSWRNLEDRIEEAGCCIVETSGLHGNDILLLTGRQVFRIVCVADEDVRRSRLEQRARDGHPPIGDQPDYVKRLMRLGEPKLPRNLTVKTSQGSLGSAGMDRLAELVRGFLEAGAGREE